MNKKIIIISAIVIIIIVAIGAYFYMSPVSNAPEISAITTDFDYSIEPTTNWNSDTNQYQFKQKITTADNKNYEDISIDVIFYKEGKYLNTSSIDIDKTTNGSFDLNFTAKLDSEPDEFYYNVTKAIEV